MKARVLAKVLLGATYIEKPALPSRVLHEVELALGKN